ncbi:MAG TPA: DICT sensory domain-containing protein [Nocardioidaceae bacterium]|nr:DICT sensory domain-containing protein [Nocardioidaceae bacterium]
MNTAGGLTIRELAHRTGVAAATLRSWETRYGAPAPRRLAGGHRRYTESDVSYVAEVLRLRASGLGTASAIARASTGVHEGELLDPSVFAGLRRRHPHLAPRVLRKPTLLALTRAIEDESRARAERPLLFASFQHERFYLQSKGRWEDLARTAERVVVFADFSGGAPADAAQSNHAAPRLVPTPPDSPLQREWFLVCDSPDFPVCVTGWQLPDQDDVPDRARRFETLWTVDPVEVRDAARICAALADTFAPRAQWSLEERLAGTPAPSSPDLRRTQSLFARLVGYLDDNLAQEAR